MTTRRSLLLGGLSLAGLAACTSGEPGETASAPTSSAPPASASQYCKKPFPADQY